MELFHNLNGMDTFILVVVALSAVIAFSSGFLREMFAIIGWVAAIISSMSFAPKMTIFNDYIQDEKIASVVAVATVFLGVKIFFMIIAYIISSIVSATPMGIFDRMFGLMFGVVRGLLFLTICYIFSSYLIEEKNFPKIVQEAKLMPIIKKTSEITLSFVSKDTLEAYSVASKKMGEIKKQGLAIEVKVPNGAAGEDALKTLQSLAPDLMKQLDQISGAGASAATGSTGVPPNAVPNSTVPTETLEKKNVLPPELDAALPKIETAPAAPAPIKEQASATVN